MGKAFKAFDHGTDNVDLRSLGGMRLMRPVEIHHKADGSLKNEPSFTIVMKGSLDFMVAGEISLEMLNEGLNEIGYQIIKESNERG